MTLAPDALAQEGGPGHTGHAHLETGHEQNVHADVGQGRDGQEVEGGLAVAQRGEDAGGDVVEEHEGQAQHVDVQIQRGICQNFVRGVDELQQAVAAHQTNEHQHGAQHGGTDQRGVDRGLHLVVVLRAEVAGHDDRAADVAAEGEGDEDQGDLVAVAHGSQRVLADELACHKAVGDVIQLLQQIPRDHRQRKQHKALCDISLCQIPVHDSLLRMFSRQPPPAEKPQNTASFRDMLRAAPESE